MQNHDIAYLSSTAIVLLVAVVLVYKILSWKPPIPPAYEDPADWWKRGEKPPGWTDSDEQKERERK